MNKKLIFIIIPIILISTYFFIVNNQNTNSYLLLNNTKINLTILDNEKTRIKGLSGADKLSENSGMLFIFDKIGDYSIWMKDMKFPIDIIWLSDEYVINHIEKNISPNTYPKVFRSSIKSKYVMELNANFVDNYNLSVGDKLNIILK